MTIIPPPIQEKTTERNGLFPQTWLRWFQHLKERIDILEDGGMSVDNYYMIAQAINEVEGSYGDTVSVERKRKSLIKFGRNANVGTSRTTVMEFEGAESHETYVSTNIIDKVVSTDNAFTGEVTIEGHTINGNDLTFVSQTVTLTGQTAVTLPTPMARATRVYITNGDVLASTSDRIFVYEDVSLSGGIPTDTSKIHIQLSGVYNQSQKCSTSISKDDYFFVTKAYGGALRKTTAIVNIELQIRAIGSENFRSVFELSSSNGEYFSIDAPPILIIPKNHDVRIVANSTTSGTEVVAGMAGYLAKIL